MVVEYYKNIFSIEASVQPLMILEVCLLQLMLMNVIFLHDKLRMTKSKIVFFDVQPVKAPSIYGYPAIFFQKYWEWIGDDICNFVQDNFNNCRFDPWVNCTLLVLIPKLESSESIQQYRPISLCTVLYKIITKHIVNRSKPFLPRWVQSNQTSFLLGRNITDNIVIAKEIIHSMRLNKREGQLVCHQDRFGEGV